MEEAYTGRQLRIVIAVLLFAGYLFLSKSGRSIAGIDAERIYKEVNRYANVKINVFDFMDNITYTLGIDSIQKE